MRTITLITGASGGIGEALAHQAARSGRELVLVARSPERLGTVAEAIASAGHKPPETVALDLALHDAGEELARTLADRGLRVAELVNNAGYGLAGPVTRLDRAEQLGIVDLNVRTLTALTLRFLPEIIVARGGVLNVASTAAFQPGPGMAIYYASKAYVVSFSQALAHELRHHIRVSALCPGPTPTGFQERARGVAKNRMGFLPRTSAERVAAEGWRGFERGQRVIIPGLANKITAALAPRVPRHLALLAAAWVTTPRDRA